ncbi:MAG: MFS transporter, partial [Propionibacteriaceae bacterium]|nr:MFS transporter [Propionibacteriaceae bacterium]
MELREAISKGRMTPFQFRVVLICILLTVVDGYEILVAAFTLPALVREWNLTETQVGLVASIGTLGMGLGAAFLSPLADRWGRRRHILLSLVAIIIGMTLSGLAPSYTAFLIFRFFAGLFLGGIVPSINALVSEYASDERRGTVMGVYGIGFPLGAAIGGVLSIALISAFGWHGPYLFSAAVTLILLIWAYFALPESVGYLVERRPKGALETYNKIGAKMGVAPATELPPATSGQQKVNLLSALQGIMLRRTILLWISYGLLTGAFYFANGYTARLVAQSTGNDNIGITAQALVAAGGVIGALVFAFLSAKIHPRMVTVALMVFGTVAFFLFASFFTNPSVVFILAVLVGLAVNGGIAAYYAISPPIYPTTIRASAVGLMMGIGRVVAFLAPNIAAFLLNRGLTAPNVYQVYGIVLLVAAGAVFLLHRTYTGANKLDAMETESAMAAQKQQAATQ